MAWCPSLVGSVGGRKPWKENLRTQSTSCVNVCCFLFNFKGKCTYWTNMTDGTQMKKNLQWTEWIHSYGMRRLHRLMGERRVCKSRGVKSGLLKRRGFHPWMEAARRLPFLRWSFSLFSQSFQKQRMTERERLFPTRENRTEGFIRVVQITTTDTLIPPAFVLIVVC